MPPTKDKKYYTVGSVDKLFNLLEVLAERDAWDFTDLVKRLGYPKTTVHRFLLTLVDRGYVYQEHRRGRYCLSFKLFSLAANVVERTSLLKIARPYAESLLGQIGETVLLTVPNGTDMLVVDKQVSPQPLRQDVQLGSAFSMINSASGRIYMAFANPIELAKAATAINFSQVPADKQRFETFLDTIPQMKDQGFEEDNEKQFSGIRCVAAPILNCDNFSCAALSVSIPSPRYSLEVKKKTAAMVMKACAQISIRLGADADLVRKHSLT